MKCNNFTPPCKSKGTVAVLVPAQEEESPPMRQRRGVRSSENCDAFRHPPANGTMSAYVGFGGYLRQSVKGRTATPSNASRPTAAKRACDRFNCTLSPAGKLLHSLLWLVSRVEAAPNQAL